jgi:hypothetical protein
MSHERGDPGASLRYSRQAILHTLRCNAGGELPAEDIGRDRGKRSEQDDGSHTQQQARHDQTAAHRPQHTGKDPAQTQAEEATDKPDGKHPADKAQKPAEAARKDQSQNPCSQHQPEQPNGVAFEPVWRRTRAWSRNASGSLMFHRIEHDTSDYNTSGGG